jgi:hypothetical protein
MRITAFGSVEPALRSDEPGGELNLARAAEPCDARSEQRHSRGVKLTRTVAEQVDAAGSEAQVL